jgi:hypothetical protein
MQIHPVMAKWFSADGRTDGQAWQTQLSLFTIVWMRLKSSIDPKETIMRAAAHFYYLVLDASQQYFHFRTLSIQQRHKTIITQQHAV